MITLHWVYAVAGAMFAVAGDEADFRLLPLGHRDDGRGEQLLADKVRPTRLAFFHELGKVEDRQFAVIDRLDALVHGEQNAVARRVGRGAQFLLNRLGTGGVAGTGRHGSRGETDGDAWRAPGGGARRVAAPSARLAESRGVCDTGTGGGSVGGC